MSFVGTNETLPWLVVSDLDGTLLGDAEATARFCAWWNSWRNQRRLVYASGRFYASVIDSIQEAGLPSPDAVISDVGTDIRMFPSGTQMIEWQSRWWTSWQLDDVQDVLDEEVDLELQPSHCQSAFKRSYFLRNARPGWLSDARRKLRERRLTAELVYSSNRDLDVLPAGANKGTAVEFLAQAWQIPRTRVLVAGDSGNDLSMFVQGFRGIVVGNAQTELREVVGPNVYRSPKKFADGVVDGLEYWLMRRSVKHSVK